MSFWRAPRSTPMTTLTSVSYPAHWTSRLRRLLRWSVKLTFYFVSLVPLARIPLTTVSSPALQTIQGKKPDGTDSSLAVVADGSPSIPAITYYTHQTATGIVVRTRVPTNGFDFEAENAFISVVGSVTLNLKGGRRRLADGAGSANRDLQAAAADEDIASFELSVSLEPKESSVGDGFVVTASSVKDGPGHEGLAVLATLLASALVFIW